MLANPSFVGAEALVSALDEACTHASDEAIALYVKDRLEELLRSDAIDLPEIAQTPGESSYGRHLLYASEEHGYHVVAMAWGGAQGTPLHDHAGVWCVEGVWKGNMEVVQHELLEEAEDGRCRFERKDKVHAGPGNCGSLIPPFEYHTLANAESDSTSITLHIYGSELTSCSIFAPLGDDWFQREIRPLSYGS